MRLQYNIHMKKMVILWKKLCNANKTNRQTNKQKTTKKKHRYKIVLH